MDKTTEGCNLDEDVMEKVLSVLPVKSLLRFRSVCSSWCQTIDREDFVRTHLENSKENRCLTDKKLVFGDVGFRLQELKQCSVYSLINDHVTATFPFHYHGANPPKDNLCSVVGCSNGLVCVMKKCSGLFYFWNPSTRKLNPLPKIYEPSENPLILMSGFGWDEYTAAYKVFAFVNKECSDIDTVIANLYSSSKSIWKAVQPMIDFKSIEECRTFLCGNLHMVSSRIDCDNGAHSFEIVRFDLINEELGTIVHPIGREVGFLDKVSLGVLKGWLSLTHISKKELDVWVMKEYNVKESWLKMMTIPLLGTNIKRNHFTSTLGEGPNGEVLVINGNILVVYDSKKEVVSLMKHIEELNCDGGVFLYFESLVSPQIDWHHN